jgi:hypothetical protein
VVGAGGGRWGGRNSRGACHVLTRGLDSQRDGLSHANPALDDYFKTVSGSSSPCLCSGLWRLAAR